METIQELHLPLKESRTSHLDQLPVGVLEHLEEYPLEEVVQVVEFHQGEEVEAEVPYWLLLQEEGVVEQACRLVGAEEVVLPLFL